MKDNFQEGSNIKRKLLKKKNYHERLNRNLCRSDIITRKGTYFYYYQDKCKRRYASSILMLILRLPILYYRRVSFYSACSLPLKREMDYKPSHFSAFDKQEIKSKNLLKDELA